MQWRNERSGVYLGHSLRLLAYQNCLAVLLHQNESLFSDEGVSVAQLVSLARLFHEG